jgi:predicted RNA-binding protein YlxR (DUF448 family)
MRTVESVRNAVNVLYSKKSGGGFNQLDVFSDPGRSVYIIRNRDTGLETEIPSRLFSKEKGRNVDKTARENEMVKAFRKLGKPCRD